MGANRRTTACRETAGVDPRVLKLASPKECEAFIENARARGREDLVKEARQRAVLLRTEAYGPKSALERRCVEAIYAYEEVLSARRGKRVSAVAHWQNVRKLGPFSAVDKAAVRADEALYAELQALGLEGFTFEAVVADHADEFSFEAVQQSRSRIARRNGDGNPDRAE
jgi:hypothetical protein